MCRCGCAVTVVLTAAERYAGDVACTALHIRMCWFAVHIWLRLLAVLLAAI
jgi:hypothetical protein